MEIYNISDQALQEYHRLARQGRPNPSGLGMRELAAEIVRRREVGAGAASVAPPLATGEEISRSIVPPPPTLPPMQGFGEGRRLPLTGPSVELLEAAESGPLRPGETPPARTPPDAPTAPNPIHHFVESLLSPRGGGYPIPKIPCLDFGKSNR